MPARTGYSRAVKILENPHAPAQADKKWARVLTYAQDSQVGPVVEDTLEVSKIGRRLEGPRVGIWDQETMKASADANGDYLIRPEKRQFDQVQAFVSAHKTLDLFEAYACRKLPWAFESETLGVGPHAGEGVNAYYQRFAESVSFYYFDSKALGKRVQTAQSADVVSHETGHAILDGLKPEYGHTFDRETKAFHEAFGDCAAMLLTLSRAPNRQSILDETGGDLTRENCLSRLGEEFGTAVRRLNNSPKDDRDYLRTHLNDFQYVDPNTLPSDGPRDELSGESHSFCQVWTRAFYAAAAGLFGQTQDLAQAGEILGQIFTLGVQMASPARARYAQMATAMLRADQMLYEGRYQEALLKAFEQAGIRGQLEELPAFTWEKAPATALEAQPLLDQLGPGGFTATRLIQDQRGYTVIEGLRKETVRHADLGVSSEVAEGITLTFDASGRLCHRCWDPPGEEAERAGLRDEMQRAPGGPATWQAVRSLEDGSLLVARLPVFVD